MNIIKNKNIVISFSFKNYLRTISGLPKVILEHQAIFNLNNISYVYLYFVKKEIKTGKNLFFMFGVIVDGIDYGIWNINEILSLLKKLKKQGYEIINLHIHSFLFSDNNKIEKLLTGLSEVPIKIFLHDFHLCCLNYQLLKNGSTFCGASPMNDDKCINCDSYKFSRIYEEKVHNIINKNIGRIEFVAPSEMVAEFFASFHPEYASKIKIIPHLKFKGIYDENLQFEDRKIRVAFLGVNSVQKGWEVWDEIVHNNKDKYAFYVYNNVDGNYKNMIKKQVSYSKENKNQMVSELRNDNIDIAVLCSQIPETYSYTCMEAYMSNCFIVTTNKSGNIADFTKKMNCGSVFENNKSVVDFFSNYETVKNKLMAFKEQYSGGALCAEPNDELINTLTLENSTLEFYPYKIKKNIRHFIINYLYNNFVSKY